jgi:nitroreductase
LELVVERSVTNPWHISEAAFPSQGSPSEQLSDLLHYAVVAPSGHNTQPWLFRVTSGGVELFADLLARVTFGAARLPNGEEKRFFHAILERRPCRAAFETHTVPHR